MGVYYPKGAAALHILLENFEPIGSDAYAASEDASLNKPKKLSVECRMAEVEINNYTEADTCTISLDYKQFPFDPRTIRSLGITVHIEDVKSNVDGQRNKKIELTTENTIFQGFADESSISFDEVTREVTIEGRDYTGLFIDRRVLDKKGQQVPIKIKQTIAENIRNLIQLNPSTKDKITLDQRVGTTRTIDPNFNIAKELQNQGKTDSYWDVMNIMAERAGAIIYVEQDRVVLTKPRNLYANPNLIQMVYGTNIKQLSFARKIGRIRNSNVRVYSTDNEGRRNNKILSIEIPKDARDPAFIKRFGNKRITIPVLRADGTTDPKGEDAPHMKFKVPNVRSRKKLIEIGEKTFAELSRQELEGELTTNDMEFRIREYREAPGGGLVATRRPDQIANFRDIRIGTPIEIVLSQFDMDKIRSIKSRDDRKDFLLKRGYPEEIAADFAESLSKVTNYFYTKSLSISINEDQGFQMTIQFINFIDLSNRGLF